MLTKLAEMVGLSPDVMTLILTIGVLVVTIAHSRGNTMPILSTILSLLGAKVPSPPTNPADPANPADPNAPAPPRLGDGHLLKELLEELRKWRRADPPAEQQSPK